MFSVFSDKFMCGFFFLILKKKVMQLVIVFQNFEMTAFCVANSCLPFQSRR